MSKLQRTYDRSRVPLYLQVASVLRQRIQSGHWEVGARISTLEELEREFQVARVTIRQAVELLRGEGLLVAQQGRGTFVGGTGRDNHWLKLSSHWEGLIDSIRANVPRHIAVEDAPEPPALEPGDGAATASYVFLRSVQHNEGEPYSIVKVHLDRALFERHREEFLKKAALYVLAKAKDVTIRHAHQTMVIAGADPEVADLLKIGLGAPTVQCRCVVGDDKGRAIYVGDIVYRSDCIKLHIDLLAPAAVGESRQPPAREAAPAKRRLGAR